MNAADIRAQIAQIDDEIACLGDEEGDNAPRVDDLYCRRHDLEMDLHELEGPRG